MQVKRVLVVDDEPAIIAALTENLESLGDGFIIESASSGEKALEKIQHKKYALVITDLYMPKINGWELIKRIRVISPQTQLILITGYPSPDVETKSKDYGVLRCIAKPVTADVLLNSVLEALQENDIKAKETIGYTEELVDSIEDILNDLRRATGSQCIMLTDASGSLLMSEGESVGVDVATLLALIAGSFASSMEISRCLGDENARNLNFHGGTNWDIYSASLAQNLCLILMYNNRVQTSRIGMVWHYTKKALQTLTEAVQADPGLASNWQVSEDFKSTLTAEINAMLTESKVTWNEHDLSQNEAAGTREVIVHPETSTRPVAEEEGPITIPLEEARARGIIPEGFLSDIPEAKPEEQESDENEI